MLPVSAVAGSFRAVPIKIFFDGKTKTAAIEVINDGQENLTIQIEVSKWDQDNEGNDVYEPTRDLIFFPKILNLAPGEEKIIRLGYEGKRDAKAEGTYRLFLHELPVSKPGEVEVKIAIKMGLPVFIKPAKDVQITTIEGTDMSEGILNVRLINSGNSHYITNRITARGIGKTGEEVFSKELTGWYVLAGRKRTYSIEIPGSECRMSERIDIEVLGDKSLLKDTHTVTRDMCGK